MDEIFDAYLSRPGVRQPILTQYCDGRQVSCEGWMTQWGSCDLGKQGYSPIEILRYFYGDSIYINTAEQISGIPASWPGSDLSQGSSGSKVRQLQEQLDAIATVYTAIPRVAPDGIYGPRTAAADYKDGGAYIGAVSQIIQNNLQICFSDRIPFPPLFFRPDQERENWR